MARKKKLNAFQLRQQKLAKEKALIRKKRQERINENEQFNTDMQQIINGHKTIRCSGGVRNNINPLPFVSYLGKLPDEIRPKVSEFISENPIFNRGCWYNANQLNIAIPELETIHGYYYPYLNDNYKSPWGDDNGFLNDILSARKDKNNLALINPKNKYYTFFKEGLDQTRSYAEDDQPLVFWYNSAINNWILLIRHSWNRYNGVHFDITKPFLHNHKEEGNMIGNWTFYWELGQTGQLPYNESQFPIVEHYIAQHTGSMDNINHRQETNNRNFQSVYNYGVQ